MVATLPLYEYECPEHGTFERMQKFSDPPLTACPTCGAPVEKLPSAPAIQFKGTGWYITDYARKSGGGDSGRDKGDSGGDKKEKGAAKESKDSPAAATPSTSTETKKTSTETKK